MTLYYLKNKHIAPHFNRVLIHNFALILVQKSAKDKILSGFKSLESGLKLKNINICFGY